jgi:hypothetical protein
VVYRRASESDVEMLLIVFIVLNAATARPDFTQVQAQVQAHLTRGEQLLSQGDYESALWNFQQANAVLSTPIGVLGAAECYEQLGDRAFAAYYYRAYLRRAPDARDGLEIAERIGDLLLTETKEGRGLLEVESAVAAKGSVDGHSYNAFPIAAFLPPGDHELLVEFPSGPQMQIVSVKTGALTTLRLVTPPEASPTVASIAPLSSSLNAEARPPWIVIAHPGSYTRLSAGKLREIFSGERIVSLNGQIAQVVLPWQGSRARAAFLSVFLGKTEASFQASWVKQVFRGGGARAPLEFQTDEEVVAAVASQPGAIGIVAADTATAGVTRVGIR